MDLFSYNAAVLCSTPKFGVGVGVYLNLFCPNEIFFFFLGEEGHDIKL